MNVALSKRLEQLLGHYPTSTFPTADLSEGSYLVYRKASEELNSEAAYRLPNSLALRYFGAVTYNLLLKVSDDDSTLSLDLNNDHLKACKTPLDLGRCLCANYSDWVGAPSTRNISTEWFKYFQYHYFDRLSDPNNESVPSATGRLNTMLLKYDAFEANKKQFDIMLWLDSSTSMDEEIRSLADSIEDLCDIIFNYNPKNRVSIVRFKASGYSSTATSGGEAKAGCRHLEFTDDKNRVVQFVQGLYEEHVRLSAESQGWYDENLWFTSNLVDNSYTYPGPLEATPPYWPSNRGSPGSNEHWQPGWSTDPTVVKLFIPITDEACDSYMSVAGRMWVPYRDAGSHTATSPLVSTAADFPSAHWDDYVVPRGPSTGAHLGETDYWQWDNGSYEPASAASRYTNPWTDSLSSRGYNRSTHTIQNWVNAFNGNNVQVHLLETQQGTKNLKWIDAYVYRWQVDILNRLNTGVIYSIQPTAVAATLEYIFRLVISDTPDRKWWNTMWNSHLMIDAEPQLLPVVRTKTNTYKKLYVPRTSVVAKTSAADFPWECFDRRNYIKIVTGGWSTANANDKLWADADLFEGQGPELNDDIPELHRVNIGDIDQTLKSIGEFIDDFYESVTPYDHPHKVRFTLSKQNSPFGVGWSNLINADHNESFVWTGGSLVYDGENDVKVMDIPRHEHLKNGDKAESDANYIRTISIVGRPEGETVGGVASVATAKRMTFDVTDNSGVVKDSEQTIQTTQATLDPSEEAGGLGNHRTYSGEVIYPNNRGNDQKPHTNMPYYCIMRAFVKG